ncbi:ABC transporter permease [Chryseolinea sp. H1M3-3]|uniref:ABC transporter permease n=1 Tax=Chryseolinea sp. H1M3-3 TaxID=3034144 RepID=UPI0023EC092B|nr:ABC transporter permease [Chryseolinea sp. H1M3-3]
MARNKIHPPRLAQRLLRTFLRDDLSDEVLGDLEEKFYLTATRRSQFKAQLNYWYQVFHYLRPFAIRKSKPTYSNHFAMYQSYFKIGWRNLLKNKGYSVINIGGLAVGMTIAILIGLWVYHELSFNKYHKNYDRIAQVMKGGTREGTLFSGGLSLPYPLIDVLKTSYAANFKHIVEALQPREYILSSGETKISRTGQFLGAGLPEMLSLEMLRGNWNCLQDPHSILLSASAAKALYGDADPTGKVLKINTEMDVKVTGVYRDLPHNTKFHDVKFFAPWELALLHNAWIKDQPWDNHFLYIYCEIAPNTSFESVSKMIVEAEMKVIDKMENLSELIAQRPRIQLLPMSDWHLRADFSHFPNYGIPDSGPVRFVILVATIGCFVLLLACINFMNLSTARSEKRAREVGIRKAMGSFRKQLVSQFFSESYLVVIFAFILAVTFSFIALPWFNSLADKELIMPWTYHWFWGCSLGFILITGLVAGSYPALYLSSFNPIKVLKGTYRTGRSASILRKVLVVAQFTVSVTLIISTIIVYNQIVFAKNRPVGYTQVGLIMVQKKSNDFYGKTDELRNELKKTGVVEEISESGGPVTNVWSNNDGFEWAGKDPNLKHQFGTLGVSTEYGKTVGWQFVEGRDFSQEFVSDSSGIVINETAAKDMGLEHPVGEIIHWKNRWWNVDKDYKIIGVVKDMVMKSPYEATLPTIFLLNRQHSYINIKIAPGVDTKTALEQMEKVFRKLIPSAPFEYQFADQQYALKFAKEERIGKLASTFGTLAVLISCLGLFGLASFVAEQRTKEIGIRKVVGATVIDLWQMLSKDFILLVLLSCLVASPIAYYSLSKWLENYAYRTEISCWIFGIVCLCAVIITLLTVSFQTIKAAMMNPVKSLKSE